MAKQPPKTPANKPSKVVDEALPDPRTARTARIRRGQAILDAVQKKAKGIENKRSDKTTMFQSVRGITEATREKYFSKEIELAAKRDGVGFDDVAVDVDLADLAHRAKSFKDSRLTEALFSGLLPLTGDTVVALLKTPSGEFEAAVSALLSQQV